MNDRDRPRRTLACILAVALAAASALFAVLSGGAGSRGAENFLGQRRLVSVTQFSDPHSVAPRADVPPPVVSDAVPAAAEGEVVPTFVFLMGLEGVGHHLVKTMLARSGNIRMIADRLDCHKQSGDFYRLAYDFFDGKREGGLFNPLKLQGWDSRGLFGEIVDILATIGRAVKEEAAKVGGGGGGGGPRNVYVPVNANGCTGENMSSYPTYRGKNRGLHSPSLDIYYQACAEAGARCRHAYLYRDPYDVIASTQRRNFNANELEGMMLYTNQLQLMYAQMLYHEGGNVGCFGLLDPDGSKRTEDIERFGQLFGFDDVAGLYGEVMTKDLVPMEEERRREMVPPEWDVLMQAFVDAHKRVLDLCYSTISE